MPMASIMEQSPYSSRRQDYHHHHEAAAASDSFNLREWALKAKMISRENTISRRFSGSNIRSFREDARSFRSNITISSTASSPGYPLVREEIDPSTYSFTTALKALQARNVYNSWECLSPDGFALNSKWNEAEKYICNPLSGEFPMECLSAKTLSARSFTNLTNTITMSGPLVYNSSNHSRNMILNKPPVALKEYEAARIPVSEKKMEGLATRDVGTQSTPCNLSSASSPSPASTPSIAERSLKPSEAEGASPNSNAMPKAEEKLQVEVKETREKEETRRDDNKEDQKKKKDEQKSSMYSSSSSSRQAGCLSWMRKRQRVKHKPRKKLNFFPHLKGC